MRYVFLSALCLWENERPHIINQSINPQFSIMRWVFLRHFFGSKSSESVCFKSLVSVNDSIFNCLLTHHRKQQKSDIFGSTKHKAVIETEKYSVFKGEILHQSCHDAPCITASFLYKQKFRGVCCKARVSECEWQHFQLSSEPSPQTTKKWYLQFYEA